MIGKIKLLWNEDQKSEQFKYKYALYYGKDLQKMSSKPWYSWLDKIAECDYKNVW